MSINGETTSHAGLDAADHQPAYVYVSTTDQSEIDPPAKRRKVSQKFDTKAHPEKNSQRTRFETLLSGIEQADRVTRRHELFERYWAIANSRIEYILDGANETTLKEVASFIQSLPPTNFTEQVPAGFIATGPNIASQSLLFKQLESKLKSDLDGPVVVLRSGDTSNLKAVLKQLIRDATSQRSVEDGGEVLCLQQGGRKLLNYDLGILHNHVKSHRFQHVVVAFQDSEAFDSSLLADLIQLFSSWMDRIPFGILFGVATSVELFQERLSRAATRRLYGSHFSVEKTTSILERIFEKVVAGVEAPVRLGPALVLSLMDRQYDHVQSVQAFTAALKYAYMSHFYGNPLSFLNELSKSPTDLCKGLQPAHLEAIRMLPSFKSHIQDFLDAKDVSHVRALLQDDKALLQDIKEALSSREKICTLLIRTMHVLSRALVAPPQTTELYFMVFAGTLDGSDLVNGVFDSIKKLTPENLASFANGILEAVKNGDPHLDLSGWENDEADLITEIQEIRRQSKKLAEAPSKSGGPIRSGYEVHSPGVRTTVVAQRVQLSHEKSTLSKQDEEFTALIDRTVAVLEQYLRFENPQNIFLNEIWLYDSLSPYRDVFTPRPRFSIERALLTPYDYLNCNCCKLSIEGLSATQPSTAILYQLYCETGSLINVFDLWSAFYTIIGGDDGEECEERVALMLFYRALADLKSLSMIKPSKKKADHVAKVSWVGL